MEKSLDLKFQRITFLRKNFFSFIMQYVTTDEIVGKKIIKVLGTVSGNTVRSRGFGPNFIAGLRTIVGGEIPEYTHLLNVSREQAVSRMRQEPPIFDPWHDAKVLS